MNTEPPPPRDPELEELLTATYARLNECRETIERLRPSFQSRNALCACGSGRKAKKCCAIPANESRMLRCAKIATTILTELNAPHP